MLLTRVFPRFTAGVCRSKSVRGPDDGVGPTVDEFFTLSLGGMVTLLNTSAENIFAGDLVEWTLSFANADKSHAKRARHGPRRIGIKTATVSSPKVIGRALSFAKPYAAASKLCEALPHIACRVLTSPLFVCAGASRLTSSLSSERIID